MPLIAVRPIQRASTRTVSHNDNLAKLSAIPHIEFAGSRIVLRPYVFEFMLDIQFIPP